MRARHDATCPSVAPLTCAQEALPDHIHDQSLTLVRMEPRFTAGLGKGFQLQVAVPIDLKAARITYTLMDGSAYTPTYGGLHHRDEDLFGLGDIRLQVGGYRMIPGTPVILGANLGLALPTGKTEETPFAAADEDTQHQHLQFGNGTVDPLASLELILTGKPVGMLGRISGRFPLYQNAKTYRGPIALSAALGPTFRLPEPVKSLQIMTLATASWMSAERWDGEVGENSGLGTVGAAVGLSWNITPKLALSGMMNFRFFEHAAGAQFNQPVAGTLGLSGFFNAPKKKKASQEDGGASAP